jgi:hypothetical protein
MASTLELVLCQPKPPRFIADWKDTALAGSGEPPAFDTSIAHQARMPGLVIRQAALLVG